MEHYLNTSILPNQNIFQRIRSDKKETQSAIVSKNAEENIATDFENSETKLGANNNEGKTTL